MCARDERLTKGLRRGVLTLNMLRRDVRTATICEWTGWTRGKVDALREDHGHEFPQRKLIRPTGRSPEALCETLRSPILRCEAAALGALLKAYGIIPREPVPDARRYLPSVSRGEGIIMVYDAYCGFVKSAQFSAEELIWLALALASGEIQDIAPCSNCDAALLLELLEAKQKPCIGCSDKHWKKAIRDARKPKRNRRKAKIAARAGTPRRIIEATG